MEQIVGLCLIGLTGLLVDRMAKPRIVRLRSDAARIGLIILLFPFSMAGFVLSAAMPARLGGHPNRSRLRQLDFYMTVVDVHLAAMRGSFVGIPMPGDDRRE